MIREFFMKFKAQIEELRGFQTVNGSMGQIFSGIDLVAWDNVAPNEIFFLPDRPFKILEPHDQEIGELGTTDFEAPKLRKGRSGKSLKIRTSA